MFNDKKNYHAGQTAERVYTVAQLTDALFRSTTVGSNASDKAIWLGDAGTELNATNSSIAGQSTILLKVGVEYSKQLDGTVDLYMKSAIDTANSHTDDAIQEAITGISTRRIGYSDTVTALTVANASASVNGLDADYRKEGAVAVFKMSPGTKFDDGSTLWDFAYGGEMEAIIGAGGSITFVPSPDNVDDQLNAADEARLAAVEDRSLANLAAYNALDVAGQIATAKSEAINTAAADATTKANTAKSEAISDAALDATTKADAAKSEAIADAALDATTKANTAKSEAITEASYDDTELQLWRKFQKEQNVSLSSYYISYASFDNVTTTVQNVSDTLTLVNTSLPNLSLVEGVQTKICAHIDGDTLVMLLATKVGADIQIANNTIRSNDYLIGKTLKYFHPAKVHREVEAAQATKNDEIDQSLLQKEALNSTENFPVQLGQGVNVNYPVVASGVQNRPVFITTSLEFDGLSVKLFKDGGDTFLSVLPFKKMVDNGVYTGIQVDYSSDVDLAAGGAIISVTGK